VRGRKPITNKLPACWYSQLWNTCEYETQLQPEGDKKKWAHTYKIRIVKRLLINNGNCLRLNKVYQLTSIIVIQFSIQFPFNNVCQKPCKLSVLPEYHCEIWYSTFVFLWWSGTFLNLRVATHILVAKLFRVGHKTMLCMMNAHKLMDIKSNLSSCNVATHYLVILGKTLTALVYFSWNIRQEEQILGNEPLKVQGDRRE
jgi:hypothetical protein